MHHGFGAAAVNMDVGEGTGLLFKLKLLAQQFGDVAMMSGRTVIGGDVQVEPGELEVVDPGEPCFGADSVAECDLSRELGELANGVSVASKSEGFFGNGEEGGLADTAGDTDQAATGWCNGSWESVAQWSPR